jgi:microcin C transport system substrate-binding protein
MTPTGSRPTPRDTPAETGISRTSPWRALLGALVLAGIAGCGPGGDRAAMDAGSLDELIAARLADTYSYPAALFEAMERGEVTREELEQRGAAGEFPLFFRLATPEDVPTGLEWEDGRALPEFSAAEAEVGGTLYLSIQDFPRTLRRVGPDANGSFRPWILDDVVMQFGKRHPNDTSIVDSNFRYYPGIAKEWALDRANRTVYVRIDPAARWSDGPPITTDDVLFMFMFHHSDWIQAPWYNNWYQRMYTNVTRYDEHTFSITVSEAKPDMLGLVLQLEPLPRHFFRNFGPDFVERYQWDFVPTSGAYEVRPADVRKGRSIALSRVDDWWASDKPFWRNRFNYQRIHFQVIRDMAKSFESFKKGEIDVFGLSLPEYWYDKLPDDDPLVRGGHIHKVVFYNDLPRPTYGLWMNSARPLLDNRDIRIGIQHATNWERVINQYFRGAYTRMRTTADGFGEFTHPTLQPRTFDVERALEHFAKAGFVRRGGDGILVNDAGQRLTFTLTTGYENLRDILTILQEEARAAGLEFRLEVLDGTAAWKKVQEKQHDIQFSAFGVAPEMYPRYWETYHSVNAYDQPWLADGSPNPDRRPKTQTNNLETIAIPELDALIEAYQGSDDAEEMKRLAWQMEELLHDYASFSPGFVMPFYRVGYWRWMRWPDDFGVKIGSSALDEFVGWIDGARREETIAARRSGARFEPVVRVYDRYRVEPQTVAEIE